MGAYLIWLGSTPLSSPDDARTQSAATAASTSAPAASQASAASPASAASVAPAATAVPFVVNFESSSGSSWLVQELAAHPQICLVLFEPIDNVTLAGAADHEARLRWLDALWSPPASDADEREWAAWRRRVEAASVFGQLPQIRTSLGRCGPRSVAFGLKARLARLLTHEAAVDGLAALVRARGARVIRLGRRDRVKQALAEYRRLRAGLGQFRAAAAGAAAAAAGVRVEMAPFRASLKAVERSHRLAARVLDRLADAPLLALEYEALLAAHVQTLARVAAFLRVRPLPPPQPARGGYVKATPDRLCAAVSNYAELCTALARERAYADSFDEPCNTPCADSGGVTGHVANERRRGDGPSSARRARTSASKRHDASAA